MPLPTIPSWNASSRQSCSSISSTRRRCSAGSDPEIVRRQVTRYFECASERIRLHGGTVEKFAGDAVMAAFGVPQAHEDDAERAVRAAFDVLDVGARARPRGARRDRIGRARGRRRRLDVRDRRGRERRGTAPAVGHGRHDHSRPGCAAADRRRDRRRGRRGRRDPPRRAGLVLARGSACSTCGRRRPQARFVGREHELELLHNSYDRARARPPHDARRPSSATRASGSRGSSRSSPQGSSARPC